jgi:hypothetical protein
VRVKPTPTPTPGARQAPAAEPALPAIIHAGSRLRLYGRGSARERARELEAARRG